ncbi:MAG: BLUF domain-containing protein [Gammaproteobacteria bacterium]|nr:BLUF domain-containing protein [Gammaproteobacteria bacterium]
MSLFNELKRRKVFKVGITYLLIAWVVAQILELVFDSFGTPDWVLKSALVLLATGFLFALFFAWVFEITPEGIKSQQEVDQSQSITPQLIKSIRENKTANRLLNSIIYKSHSKDLANLDLVESILESSIRNNPIHGITGVLIVTETHFLQVLEGEFEPLNATFQKICLDKRHDTVQLISFTEIKERRFSEWAMHGIGLFDLNRELKLKLCLEFGEDQGNIRLPTTATEILHLMDMLLSEKTPGKDD